MKYINCLHIINFQSHANTYIELDKGLNIFVGESDQGKTAIIRALRWLFYNEPRGTGFIRVGENRCEVTAVLNDGTKVTRLRDEGKRQNRYIINYPDGEELILEKFSNELPLEVQKELGVYPLWIDNDLKLELNLARQLDSPFLMAESPANRAKIIGRIANLHIIDAAQRDLLRDIRNLSAKKNELEIEIENLNIDKQNYADIPDKEKQLKEIKLRLDKIQILKEKCNELENLKKQKEKLDTDISNNEVKLKSLENIDYMVKIYEKTREKINYYASLVEYQNKLNFLNAELNKFNSTINKLDKLDEANLTYKQLLEFINLNKKLQDISEARESTVNRLSHINDLLKRTARIAEGDVIIHQLYDLRQEGFRLQEVRKVSRQLNKEINHKNSELLNVNNKLQKLTELDKAPEIINKQNLLLTRLQALLILNEEKQKTLEKLKMITHKLEEVNNYYKGLQQDFINILNQAERCPTCGSSITPNLIAEIVDKTAI